MAQFQEQIKNNLAEREKPRQVNIMMKPKPLALALATPLCWGTSFTIAKPAVAHFPPLFMMLLVYAGIAVITLFTVRGKFKTPWPHLLLISALSVTIQGAFLFTAMQGVEATTANLVLQTQVPAAVFLGWLLAGEKLDGQKILGTAIALVGVAIVIGLPEKRPALTPVLMIIASGAVWAAGQVLARKLSLESGVMLLKANALFGVPQLLLATILLEGGQLQSVQTASAMDWAMLAFVGFIGFYVAYILWFSLLKIARVDEAAPFILLMTPIGLITAVLFLGERMSLAQIIGATVLMFGLAIVNGITLKRLSLTFGS
jgi:O-acetylserine/cysteine efflux transporter